jgi:glycosyltransferase involved in cell wall biosynthesis
MSNKRILCFLDYYTPGYKAGGPIKTISNMVNALGGNQFNFLIVTRNHDLKSDVIYDTVKTNKWQKVANAIVFYTKIDYLFIIRIFKIIKKTNPDIIYLNSFFSKLFSIAILLVLKFSLLKKAKIIIAPRGEFSMGALKFKKLSKYCYLLFFKQFINNQSIYFQVSSEFERNDLLNQKINSDRILIAPNIINGKLMSREKLKINDSGVLKVIFYSRISPMKNLFFLVEILSEIKEFIDFEVCGPIEDIKYWGECMAVISNFPPNINFKYNTSIEPQNVSMYLSRFDLLILPTLGENFGHVIIESLSAGLPVLISDRTLWKSNGTFALTSINLVDKESWRNEIGSWARMSSNDLLEAKYLALDYANDYFINSTSLKQNISLFSI